MAAIVDGLGQFADFSKGLAGVGKLGEALPLVRLSPGAPEALGFNDLLQTALVDKVKDKAHFGDLSGTYSLPGAPGDRSGDVKVSTSKAGAVERLDVELDISRHVTGQPLNLTSTSPKVNLTSADAVSVDVTLTGKLSFAYDTAQNFFYLIKDSASPSLNVDATASLAATGTARAAFGILGVDIEAGSTLNASAHLRVSMDDPNSDGKLAFLEPGGKLGELAASGAASGLVHAGFANPAGEAHGSITFKAQPLAGTSLPDASVTLNLDWPDVSAGAPTISVSAGSLFSLDRFQNLTPRDLIEGLAQLSSAIEAIQRTQWGNDPLKPLGNVNLPFMRGTLADAIAVGESITSFVEQNVYTAAEDLAKEGQPKFASLQELFSKLNTSTGLPGGATLSVGGVSYEDAASKLAFTISIHRAATGDQDLDHKAADVGGIGSTVSYTDTTLKDTSQSWEPNAFVGRTVSAGASTGIVASNTTDTVTLRDPWNGGKPLAASQYRITAPDPQNGQVTFGDTFGAVGLKNANAVSAIAKVNPSYDASVTLVLDLQAPKTGAACGTPACPFSRTNADGTTTVVDSLPIAPDRVMLRTGSNLVTADLPISTSVDVNGAVGFLKVHLKGSLEVTPMAGEHMLKISLKNQGDVPLREVFSQLASNPSQLLTVDVKAKAFADLSADVPGGQDFLSNARVTVTMADITTPDVLTVDTSQLNPLRDFNFDPDNPAALLGQILRALQLLSQQLSSVEGSGPVKTALTTPIPVIGASFSDLLAASESGGGALVTYGSNTLKDTGKDFTDDLVGRALVVGTEVAVVQSVNDDGDTLTMTKPWDNQPEPGAAYGFRSELLDAVDRLTASPADSLQDLLPQLNSMLGSGSSVKFTYKKINEKPTLVLTLDMQRQFTTERPVSLDLGTDGTVVSAQGQGTASVTVTGKTKVGLALPLEIGDGTAVKVMPDSEIAVTVGGGFDDASIRASVGPLSMALGNPSTTGSTEKASAKARYDIALSHSPTTGDPVSLSSFVNGLDLKLNSKGNGISCPGDPSGADKLSLCAYLPVYVSTDGTTWTALSSPGNAFAVRLPYTSDVNDVFKITGNLPNTGTPGIPRLETPTDLANKIKDALFDFSTLPDGLDKYLALVEVALGTASFDGKLPLVGKDLQQGQAFIGDLRKKVKDVMKDLPNGGRFPTPDEAQTWLENNLAKVAPEGETVSIKARLTCNWVAPSSVTVQPTVEVKDPPQTTVPYTYGVVAIKDGLDSKLTQGTASGAPTLNDKNYNQISWPAVKGAEEYRVLKKVGSDWVPLGKVTTLSFKDEGSEGSGTYEPNTENPIVSCKGMGASTADILGVEVSFDVGQGTVDATAGCTTCATAVSRPLDIGIPGLSFKASGANPNVEIGYAWQLHLSVGLDRKDGFYVRTQDTDRPELGVGLAILMPDEMTARIAILEAKLTPINKPTDNSLFSGAFQIDLHKPGKAACFTGCTVNSDRLTLSELANPSRLVDFQITGGAHIHWNFDVTAAPLPGIGGQFLLDWKFSAGSSDGSKPSAVDPTIKFDKVYIDAGAFFGSILGPIIKQVKDMTGPVQPVIDQLYAPIPVLSDLSRAAGGGDVNLVTIAKAFSTVAGGPDLTFVDRVLKVIQLINQMPSEGARVPIGSFTISADKALNTKVTPDTAKSLIASTPGLPSKEQLKAGLDQAATGKDMPAGGFVSENGIAGKAGFTFPVLDSPSSLFGLLLGQDVELVRFDSGTLRLGFSYSQSFGPVYAPPPVFVTISGSASVSAHIIAGFDTYGIRKAIEEKKVGLQILDSLYLVTVDDTGKPLPVITLKGRLAAGAEVSAVIISAGVRGGIELTINLTWNDPDNDGKFRFSEFGVVAMRNPICLFNMDGKLSLFLQVYITLGISPFSVSFDFNLANITLLDFSVSPNCTPPPPKLAKEEGDVLVLFAGKLGTGEARGDAEWRNIKDGEADDENFVVTQLFVKDSGGNQVFDGFAVSALGHREEFRNTNLKGVLLDGRDYPGSITAVFQGNADMSGAAEGEAPQAQPFDKAVYFFGGKGDDSVKTGIGPAFIDGGLGNDQITTGDLHTALGGKGNVVVAGGGGNDVITVGGGNNWVAGDGKLTYGPKTITVAGADVIVPNWVGIGHDATEVPGQDGRDRISAGLGANEIWGGGGDDVIGIAADNPLKDRAGDPAHAAYVAQKNTIIGGTGGDVIAGGSNDDTIYTGGKLDTTIDGPGFDEGNVTNTVDTGTGSDTVYGSSGQDLVTGHSMPNQSDTFYGGGGNDVLMGGYGQDKLYGGPGDDWLIAEPSQVGPVTGDDGFGPARTVTHLPVPASVTGPSKKLLVGGFGRDHIVGGDGGADIYGDAMVNGCLRGSNPVSDPPAESGNSQDGQDLIIGGEGMDVIAAGGGDDVVDARGGNDLVCGQDGNDTLRGGSGNDTLYGGSGKDIVYGDAGTDEVFGNDGDDTLYGGDGPDILEGNAGNDWISGGTGNDLVIGGTRMAGRPDGSDTVYGDAGNDVLIGDNGDMSGPFDLDGLTSSAGTGDTIYGGDGDDRAYGGLGNDVIYGGADNDYLEGNNGSDRIFGEAGEDVIFGGSSQEASPGVGRPDKGDLIDGGSGNDLILGDNAVVTKSDDPSNGSPVTLGRGFTKGYTVRLLDLGDAPTAGTSGDDEISGGAGQDVIYGQGGNDLIRGGDDDDYAEGGPGVDSIYGDGGDDDLVGGSSTPFSGMGDATVGQQDSGDPIDGGEGADVVLGDNGMILRVGPASPLTQGRGMTSRGIVLYDLGLTPKAGTSGDDLILGNNGTDVILGQGGDDQLKGNAGDDYVEGGPGADWIEGNEGDDDLVGGSSTVLSGSGDDTAGQPDGDDTIFGGAGDDVVTGDNALVLRIGTPTRATIRLGTTSAGMPMTQRSVQLFDLRNGGSYLTPPPADRYGSDRISGGDGVDVIYGQDGPDSITGDAHDDYIEGNGGNDTILGGTGQDDIIGGSSMPGFRDGDDTVNGNEGDDVILGDNGTLVRTLEGTTGSMKERVYTERYPTGQVPADATVVRTHDPAKPGDTTRFCTTKQATCEPVGAFGNDTLYGDDGNDAIWGQDGDDVIYGGAGDDDLIGELGDDRVYGGDGEDVILGDRGGIINRYMNADDVKRLGFTVSTNNPPKETYTGFRAGTYDRRVDLLHDTDGQNWVAARMPHDGITEGGDDLLRGGAGNDNIHGGWGDDIINGDSGGDQLFGGDGADVIWGGMGCDPVLDANTPDCKTNGKFDLSARGTNDRFVDHIFGGTGGTSKASLDGVLGADILDWKPRGDKSSCIDARWPTITDKKKGITQDPCIWFDMTEDENGSQQHHQGIDWIYGGWDRDVMQADVAANGPNNGDRLMDWNGNFNLFSHCNSAYGGWNDIRQHSPQLQNFLAMLAWGSGAGRTAADATTSGTSAFRELAMVYPQDNKDHGTGQPFPGSPGHFDDPVACSP